MRVQSVDAAGEQASAYLLKLLQHGRYRESDFVWAGWNKSRPFAEVIAFARCPAAVLRGTGFGWGRAFCRIILGIADRSVSFHRSNRLNRIKNREAAKVAENSGRSLAVDANSKE